jgi:eukaryotic-like serine/threonine-protein kinase
MSQERKEESYSKKLAHFCDEVSSFAETPIIDNIKDSFERYTELDFLNEGGAKILYRCLDNFTGREVAMAKLKDNSSTFRQERFLQEAQLTSSLQHPNIVPVYDLGLEEKQPWFTMKLISGRSLYKILEEDKKNQLSPNDKLSRNLDYFLKVCDAMAYSHSKGVLHLDLKPDNIQIGNYGDLVVCDWGLANILAENCDENMLQFYSFNPFDRESVTVDGMIKGTPGYMAPEQASLKKAKKNVGTDIFSLGAILYNILCYEKPFKGHDLKQVIKHTCEGDYILASKIYPQVPKALEAICKKAMQVKSEDRYASVLDLQQEVLNYREGFATDAENASFIKLMKLWVYRNKIISAFTSFTALMLIIFAYIYFEKISLEKENALQLAKNVSLENEFHRKMGRDSAPRFLERAQMAYSSFELDDAINFSDSAVDLNPDLIEAWQLKAELHFIKEEFSQALKAVSHTSNQKFIALCEKFAHIKSNDAQVLDITDLIELIRITKEMKFTQLTIRFIRHKANTEMSLEMRLQFALNATLIMNQTNKINFSYDQKNRHLDLSNNSNLSSAIAFQNFPNLSTDLSHTKISDFSAVRNQDVVSLNVSSTEIGTLHSLNTSHTSLRKLNISHTNIRSLMPIKNRLIEELDISWTAVNKVSDLKNLPNLETLTIHSHQFSKGQIKNLSSRYKLTIIEKR